MPRTATSEITAKVVGAEIRRARTELGLTQSDVAARLQVGKSYLANVEAGRANLTLGQLAHIANALGTGLMISLPVQRRRRIELPDGTA